MQEPEIDWDYVYSHLPGYVSGTSGGVPELGFYSSIGDAYHFATIEESVAYKDEYLRKYEEEIERNKKDLPTLCIVKTYSNNGRSWLALMTEEEVAKSKEIHSGLDIIFDYLEYLNSLKSSNSNEDGTSGGCGISSSSNNVLSSSSYTEFPQWDERIVAYLSKGSANATIIQGSEFYLLTDADDLKEVFQVALNEDNFDFECDYFSIHITQNGLKPYFVISKDSSNNYLEIYNIHPSLEQPNSPYDGKGCMDAASFRGHSFLICDKEGGLKDKFTLSPPPIIKYNDPAWDCWVQPNPDPFFELRK